MAPDAPQSADLGYSSVFEGSASDSRLQEIERPTRWLQALSRAAINVTEAQTPDEVHSIVGVELEAIGLQCQFSRLDDDGEALIPQYLSLSPGVRQAAERLLGMSFTGFCLPVDQVSALRVAVRERRTVFTAGKVVFQETFPGAPTETISQVVALIGAPGVIVAPLLIRGQVTGAISVWANDLDSTDVPASSVFAQLAATACEDVSRDVAAERALERAKDEFLAIAAHELRSPLAALKGYSDLLRRGLSRAEPPPELGQIADQVGRMSLQIERLTVLVETLLDVAHIEAGRFHLKLKAVDAVPVAQALIEQIQRTAPAHQVSLQHSQPQVVVVADPTRLVQVMRNLLENAIKFSPQGGPITVELDTVPDTDGARPSHSTGSIGMAEIRVIDHGIGIPLEHLPHIFGSFYHVERALTRRTGGLGLGLYASKRLVEAQGGTIRVESQPGVGSIFAFTLPLAPLAQ